MLNGWANNRAGEDITGVWYRTQISGVEIIYQQVLMISSSQLPRRYGHDTIRCDQRSVTSYWGCLFETDESWYVLEYAHSSSLSLEAERVRPVYRAPMVGCVNERRQKRIM